MDLKESEAFFRDLPQTELWEFFRMMTEKHLGRGAYRRVWSFNDECVIKYELQNREFKNIHEWQVWKEAKNTSLEKWLAPCHAISNAGNWLIQYKTTPVTLEELKRKLPRVPAFFSDLKVGNWGKYKGRIVCHDYSNNNLDEVAIKSTKTRKARWWDNKGGHSG